MGGETHASEIFFGALGVRFESGVVGVLFVVDSCSTTADGVFVCIGGIFVLVVRWGCSFIR